jgi:hypothetical protein
VVNYDNIPTEELYEMSEDLENEARERLERLQDYIDDEEREINDMQIEAGEINAVIREREANGE